MSVITVSRGGPEVVSYHFHGVKVQLRVLREPVSGKPWGEPSLVTWVPPKNPIHAGEEILTLEFDHSPDPSVDVVPLIEQSHIRDRETSEGILSVGYPKLARSI